MGNVERRVNFLGRRKMQHARALMGMIHQKREKNDSARQNE